MQGTVIKQWHPLPWTNNIAITIRRLGRNRFVVDKTMYATTIYRTCKVFDITDRVGRRKLIGIVRTRKEADVYMFPVKEGLNVNATLPLRYHTDYTSLFDGWCVIWFEHAKFRRNDNDLSNQGCSEHRMFIDKEKAELLAARLLLGLAPDEPEYDWIIYNDVV